MTAALVRLNPAAQVALAAAEQRIERGLKTFIDAGHALAEIRDSRLYKCTHETFEDYCSERWGITDRRARQLMEAAEIGNVFPVENSQQANALARVPEPERADVLREAADRAPKGKATAKAISEVAKERAEIAGIARREVTKELREKGLSTPEIAAQLAEPAAPVTPPPGSPASWTPEQVEENRKAVETRRMREAGRRRAKSIVSAIWAEISTVTAAAELGEHGLVTAEMVAEIQKSVDFLAKFVEAEA